MVISLGFYNILQILFKVIEQRFSKWAISTSLSDFWLSAVKKVTNKVMKLNES